MPNMSKNYNSMWNNPYSTNSYNYLNNSYMNQNQQLTQPQMQLQSSQNNIIWVKGKENARSMQLPPNSTVILLDGEVGKFYIKTTDDIGLGKLRIFSYIEEPDTTEQSSTNSNIDLSNYVTKKQFDDLVKEIKGHEQSISTIKQKSKSEQQQFTTINKQF